MCMFFENSSGLRALTEAKLVAYGRAGDNTLLRHVQSTVVFSERAWNIIVFPIRLALWSEQLRPQLHVILAQVFRYQNCQN